MDGQRQIFGVGTHLDGQTDLAQQLTTVGTDDGTTDDAVAVLVEDQLGHTVGAIGGDCTAGSSPGEGSNFEVQALLLGFLLGQTDPGHLWLCVGDGRDHFRVEVVLLAGDDFGRHVAFVHTLVSQHRLTDDVTDGVDVRNVGTQLLVHFDETALVDGNTGFLGVHQLAVRHTTDRDQHVVVANRLGRGVLAFVRDVQAVFTGFNCGDLGLQHDVEFLGNALGVDLDDVFVRSRYQLIGKFHHVDLGTQGGVNGTHLQTYDAAADNQQLARYCGQFQRIG
ncbi:hypothetical protein D3C80_868020 [compost metagenome]